LHFLTENLCKPSISFLFKDISERGIVKSTCGQRIVVPEFQVHICTSLISPLLPFRISDIAASFRRHKKMQSFLGYDSFLWGTQFGWRAIAFVRIYTDFYGCVRIEWRLLKPDRAAKL